MIFLLFSQSAMALSAIRGKVEIRESDLRAQLSILMQVIEDEDLNPGTKQERILSMVRDALKTGLARQSELKKHSRFTHVFVTMIKANADEDVVAVFSKTPYQKRPTLNIFSEDLPVVATRP